MIRHAGVWAVLQLVAASGYVFGADTTFERTIKPFIAQHCVDCHGPELQKATLRFDNLAPEFAEKDAAQKWIKALDKMASGQMPPASVEAPPKADLAAVTAALTSKLHDGNLAVQRKEGRVLLRRLNRIEYDNTLSDLLEVPIDVKDLLPDDNVVAGFDNVSDGLDMSASHFLRYQEAAEAALIAAIPTRPKTPFKERKTAKQFVDGNEGFAKNLGNWALLRGESLFIFGRPRFGVVEGIRAPLTGRYKMRVSCYAANTNGKSLPLTLHQNRGIGRAETEVRGCKDAPPDKAAVLEFEIDLKAKDRVTIQPWTLLDDSEFRREAKFKDKEKLPENFVAPAMVLEWWELEGPLDPEARPGYKRLFGDVPLKVRSVVLAEQKKQKVPKIKDVRSEYEWNSDPWIPSSANPKEDAEKLIRDFLPRAARRPVSKETADYFVAFAHERLDKNYTFGEAMIAAYKSILCSPTFLLLDERAGKLDDYALASRLSYFLWRSMPDQELLDLAAKGTLSKKEVLTAQVERLLNHERSEKFIDDFTGQWLDLRKINATSPDPQMYAESDQYLTWSMPQETKLFFTEILKKDLSVTNFIHSDWTFVNERLAQHYGFPGVAGCEFRKVTIPPESHRGGVMTQSAILKVTADGTRTSPIIRGVWVLEHIIGKPPSPPPPDVPAIEPDIRGATTIRKTLEKHRAAPACASCHKHIDPPGFALETFDVIGGWREFYRVKGYKAVELVNYPIRKVGKGPNVEKGDKTPEGRPFKDIDEYKTILLEDKDQIARNICRKLLTIATGATVQFADREVVEQIVTETKKKNHGLRSIVHAVVQSRAFLNK